MDNKERASLNVTPEVLAVVNELRQKRPDRRGGYESADDVLRRVLGLKERR